MYRKVEDFIQEWSHSANGTLQVLEALTDEKLDQAIVEGHNTLGWLGWHLTTAPLYFVGQVGIQLEVEVNSKEVPNNASEIVQTYKKVSEAVTEKIKDSLTDEKLVEEVDSHGSLVPRGKLLRTLVDHQTHHRGQMTVLLRQAGLPVPGVMGPTKEQRA
ncbi:damage-inducible protein DinB [Oceanobacillus piezotolerans]|uniref:Damage-inducible protein DinB n=1 Tax=Oceanobacillus piezotolerans TaxID=2448030 RepID=A0A498DAR5_9BACI|nr:DinB family protein [Oceanobacillus piezotolerans]RLL45120.1 damage-inducible protein DinB [Oceanobacillus piezotolerans]